MTSCLQITLPHHDQLVVCPRVQFPQHGGVQKSGVAPIITSLSQAQLNQMAKVRHHPSELQSIFNIVVQALQVILKEIVII